MMHESLPQTLRVLRARRGWTLVEAARRAGVGRDTLSDLERGRQHPNMPTLAKLARAYSVPVEELLEESAFAGKAEASAEGAFGDRKLPPESSGSEAGQPSAAKPRPVEEHVGPLVLRAELTPAEVEVYAVLEQLWEREIRPADGFTRVRPFLATKAS